MQEKKPVDNKIKAIKTKTNLYQVVIPFDDGSSFFIWVTCENGNIEPVTDADKYLFDSLPVKSKKWIWKKM